MYLIANWKQNIVTNDIEGWVKTFGMSLSKPCAGRLKIVIAPAFPQLHQLKDSLVKEGLDKIISIGVQNISRFDMGAHTGEVGVAQIADVASYAIIGHSERRLQGEGIQEINQKIKHAISIGIVPIICFSNLEEYEAARSEYNPFKKNILFVYEPVLAIGTGNATSVEDLRRIHKKLMSPPLMYGGSVDKNSLFNYLKLDFIKGFLVGTVSLNPQLFAELANSIV